MDHKYRDALDALHPLYQLASELDEHLMQPVHQWTASTRNKVHDLVAAISGHLFLAENFDEYTGGDILTHIENARDEALMCLAA